MASKNSTGKILNKISKVKHYAGCLEYILNKNWWQIKTIFKVYIDRTVLLVLRNNKQTISDYTSPVFPLSPPFNDDYSLYFIHT
jgi:hypothetical protein